MLSATAGIGWLLILVTIVCGILVVKHIRQLPPSTKLFPDLRGIAIIESKIPSESSNSLPVNKGYPTILHFKRTEVPQIYSFRTGRTVKLLDPSLEPEELSGALLLDLYQYKPPLHVKGSGYVSFIMESEEMIDNLPVSIGVNALFFRDGVLRALPPRTKRKKLPINQVINIPLEYELRLSEEHIYPGNRLALAVCLTDLSGKAYKLNHRLLSFGISVKSVQSETTSITCWPIDSTEHALQVLTRLGPASITDRKLLNSVFRNVLQLPESFKREVIDAITVKNHVPSNPTLLNLGDKGIVRVVRLVNYYMLDHLIRIEPRTYSSQYAMQRHGTWSILKYDLETPIAKGSRGYGSSFVCTGVEDIRIFSEGDRLLFMGGSRDFTSDGNHTMVMGEIKDGLIAVTKQFKPVFSVEKNHSPIIGTKLVVHSWCPLRIYNMETSDITHLDVVHDIPKSQLPACFQDMRGSSCGVPYPSTGKPREFWFLIHWSFAQLNRREAKYYTHAFVRLDAETFRPVGYTVPFIFERGSIEFSCGMALIDDDKTMLVSYSVEDANPTDVYIPVEWILSPKVCITDLTSISPKTISSPDQPVSLMAS